MSHPCIYIYICILKLTGMTSMLRASSTLSAATVVGPLAPSAMILAWIFWAIFLVMAFSTAAGTRMSHFSSIRFPSNGLALGKPTIVPLSCSLGNKAVCFYRGWIEIISSGNFHWSWENSTHKYIKFCDVHACRIMALMISIGYPCMA